MCWLRDRYPGSTYPGALFLGSNGLSVFARQRGSGPMATTIEPSQMPVLHLLSAGMSTVPRGLRKDDRSES